MIPAERVPPGTRLGAAAGAEPAGEGEGLVEVLETNLDCDLLPLPCADSYLMAERRLEPVGGVAKRRLLLRVEPPGCRGLLWLASQLSPVLGLANRPAVACRFAAETAADVVSAGREKCLAVSLAELAGLEQGKHLVRKIEEADQIGARRAAASAPPCQVLLGDVELFDQRRAGAGLLDRVEILAHHVL